MADSTKINQLQEKLLEANSIITNKIIEGISFDKTITCNIIDDTYKKEGKYIVSNGAQEFTAYSTVTNYSVNNTVYVTIPNGDYANQKIIIGKKTSNEDKPFVFTTPFDTMVDLTGNTIETKSWSALANEKDVRVKEGNTASFKELSLASYTRLGISANFQTWIGEAVTGNYGLKFILHTRTQNTIGVAKKETDKDYYKYSDYDIYLQVSDMYGNPYNFESYYNQQKVIDITDCGEIIGIDIELFQEGDFVDSLGVMVPSTDGMDIRLFDNIFVKDIYICAGNDVSEFNTDYVKLYTTNKTTYAKEERTTNEKIPTRELELRWVHLFDGNPKQIKELDSNSEIHWYRYRVGAAAADNYCGVYWEGIENKGKDPFKLQVELNTEQQQEKFKAIAFYNKVPYRSNEVVFDNEEIVPSQETLEYESALQIRCEDGTNGNYLVYKQNDDISETDWSTKERKLSLWFNPNPISKSEAWQKVNDIDNVQWTVPTSNTMLRFNTAPETDEVAYKYTIASNYVSGYTNNSIACTYTVEGRTYRATKEFTFGYKGTMGADETIVIDIVDPVGDAITIAKNQTVKLKVSVYQGTEEIKDIDENGIKWDWYKAPKPEKQHIHLPKKEEELNKAEINLTVDAALTHGELYIIQVKVGELYTYYPIALKSEGCTHIIGPKQVLYRSNGEMQYIRDPYQLFNGEIVFTDITARVIGSNDDYCATIVDNKLKPISMYIKDADTYGVILTQNNKIYWTQPILVFLNQWSSGTVNKWDGKTLEINETDGYILGSAIAVGKKNSNNSFSGVMLGDWSRTNNEADEISKQTGIYGFHEGAMSYAFKEDGTAFIGKDGKGRINFDGNNATIYSETYGLKKHGIKIDLNDPYIIISNSYNQDSIANSNTDTYPFQVGSKFKVKWDGTIYATNGEFSGHIEADSGHIGHWEIDEYGRLVARNNDKKVTLSLSANESGGYVTVGKTSDIQFFGNKSQIWIGKGIMFLGEESEIRLTADTYESQSEYSGPIIINQGNNQIGGIGFIWGNNTERATSNIGLKSYSGHSIILESGENIRLTASNTVYIAGDKIEFIGAAGENPKNQTGIYARFA